MSYSDAHSTLVRLCPDCGGHLGDTWDEESQECGRCGFRYVSPQAGGTTSTSSTIASLWSVVLSIVIAMFGGIVSTNSNVLTVADGGAVVFNGFDLPFAVAVASVAIAIALAGVAVRGGVRDV